MKSLLRQSIERALNYLNEEQRPDGGYMCLVSREFDHYRLAEVVPAIVPTNIVLSSLVNISNDPLAERITKRAADFLLTQVNDYWSVNYWFRGVPEDQFEPYPDDTDDTFCALAALYEYDSTLFTPEIMAKILTMLVSSEKQEGGPYDMWLVPSDARTKWNDTDLVVNSNIAYFLSLQGVTLPNVIDFVERSIDESRYEFPYNRIYPAIYFISRFYRGNRVQRMIDLLLSNQEQDGKWENPLRTALAISALVNLSADRYLPQLARAMDYLLRTQGEDGAWLPYSFYYQMKTSKRILYAGSSSITTALCIEALHKFEQATQGVREEVRARQGQDDSRELVQRYDRVVAHVRERFGELGPDVQRESERILERVLKGDASRQIVLLPQFFFQSLRDQEKVVVDDERILDQLGEANVFGWMAYTIFDDFLDDEGESKLLPVATTALRESWDVFQRCVDGQEWRSFVKQIFDTMEEANAWEVSHCRFVSSGDLQTFNLPNFGDYSQLAHKSLGHALSPFALLFRHGFSKDTAEIQSMRSFFIHYLIARQLDDDAHDWEADLGKGQVNSVGANILEYVRDRTQMRRVFWEQVAGPVCRDILRHTELARNAIDRLNVVVGKDFFYHLLEPIERSAKKVLSEQSDIEGFVDAYKLL